MSILGYDPARFHTGRAPDRGGRARACSCGPTRSPTAATSSPSAPTAPWSTSPVAIPPPRTPPRSSRPSTPSSAATALEFHPGVQYRHILVAPADWADADCTPPHDLTDKPAVLAHRRRPPRSCSALMDASREVVGGFGLARQPDLAVGPGLPAPDAVASRSAYGARRRPGHRRRPRPRPRRAHRHRGRRRRPAPPAGTTPTTRASATPPSTRSPTAPTSSSSTSRPPTRPATPATSRRRSRRSRTGTAASSPAWSRASTRWARGGCCCCPTTPRPSSSRPTPPTRCPTCWSTPQVDGPGGVYTEAGVADARPGPGPRADGPPRQRPLIPLGG